jgi:hypothetical protein
MGFKKELKQETKGVENLFNEIIAGNFPNLGKDKDIPL